jgi:hypothetical protein
VAQNEELRLASVAGRELPLQYCEPPEPYRTRISEMTTQAIVEAAQAMPPKIDLMPADPAAPSPDPAVVMAQKEQLRLLRALARWGWVLPFSLLGVIMALVVRSLRGLARWWGTPLLVGGLLSILAVLFASGVTQRLISQAFAQAGIPEGLVRLLQSILVGLREQILGRMLLHGLLLTLGAGVLLFVGFLVGRRTPKPVPSPVPPAAAEPAVAPAGADATATKRAEPMPASGEGGPKGIFG